MSIKNINPNNISSNDNLATQNYKTTNLINRIQPKFDGKIDTDYTLQNIIISKTQNSENIKVKLGNHTKPLPSDNYIININNQGIGGRLDLIDLTSYSTQSNLIWAVGTEKDGFLGFGVSRWMESTFTAVSSGTKGSTATFTTAGTGTNNCYQFNVGARVRVNATAQYNFGTITAINSASSIEILMDNGSNGTNITATTATSIKQFDNFQLYDIYGNKLYENATLIGYFTFGADESSIGGSNLLQSIIYISKWETKRLFNVAYNWIDSTFTASGHFWDDCTAYVSPNAKSIGILYMLDTNATGNGRAIIRNATNQDMIVLYIAAIADYKYVYLEIELPKLFTVHRSMTYTAATVRFRSFIKYYTEED